MNQQTHETADGFTVRTLHIYARGPNDPPGNAWIMTCPVCCQTAYTGHADGCKVAASIGHEPTEGQ